MSAILLTLLLIPAGAEKIDPEPPPKGVVGTWTGVWGGYNVTAVISPNGLYYDKTNDCIYAGTWKYYPRTRVLEIELKEIPMDNSGTNLYSFTVSKCGQRISDGGPIRMKRLRR